MTVSDLDLALTRERMVWIAVVACLLNVVVVGALAATGTLKTAETGDIERVHTTNVDGEEFTLPDTSHGFVSEDPTDADVFYNVVLFVQNGGSLYHGNGYDPFIQLTYNYTPALYPLFVILTAGGYIAFKVVWLLLSIGSTIVGTALLVDAERDRVETTISCSTVLILGIASVGFQPMVTNFKVGQTTPFMYLFVALSWWLLRDGRDALSGATLAGTALFKPYFIAPLAAGARRNRFRALPGFLVGLLVLNVVSIAVFDVGTLLAYYEKLYRFITAEGAAVSYESFDDWSPTHVRPFYWLGPLEGVVRFGIVSATLLVAALHALGVEDEPLGVYALSITSIMMGLRTATGVDMAMLLVPLVLLGFWLYGLDSRLLPVWLGSFLAFMAHEYVLELLVGAGTALPIIGNNESLVVSYLPVLQPATYGLFLLYFVGLIRFRTVRRRVPELFRP